MSARRGIGLEVTAIVLLLIGGVVVPVLGWFAGLALLWASSAWPLGDKLLGTFVLPGGLLPAALMSSDTFLSVCLSSRSGTECEGGPGVAGILVFAVAVIAPILTAIHLGRRLGRA